MKNRQQVIETLHTVRDYVRWGTSLMARHQVFFGHGTDNAWDESLFLVQAALDLPEPITAQIMDSRLLKEERAKIVDWLSLRVEQRLPLPYISGRAWFAGLSFAVDRRVIIPRSPIAELIEQQFAPWYPGAGIESVLDLCCGSGCIGIACAAYLPDARVDLLDISAPALELARDNISLHQLEDRVTPIQSDLFAGLAGRKVRYDVIVSNPPYVDSADLASMPAEFRHEPGIALAAGEDGLELAHRILRDAPNYLNADGLLVLEVGNSAEALEQYYCDVPFTWVDFEHGGDGVLAISAQELRAYCKYF